jgi:hypothetical protein
VVEINDIIGKTSVRVADRVLESLGQVPERKRPNDPERRNLIPRNEPKWPPAQWSRSPRRGFFVVQDPIINPRSLMLNVAPQDLTPDTDEFLFETDLGVPSIVAVSWPKALNPKNIKSIPFLVYFRPKPNTTGDRWGPSYVGASSLGEYPYGWDFLYYQFWAYLNYRSDPLTYQEERWHPSKDFLLKAGPPGLTETHEKFSFGLPYQIAASGKPVVLVFPLLHHERTLGQFFKADVVQETLEAIHGHVLKKMGVQEPHPSLGSIALAGYSFSVDFVRQFLEAPNNVKHPLLTQSLKEIYLFDPSQHKDAGNRAIKAAVDWADRDGASASRAIRVYSQTFFEKFEAVLGGRVADGPFSRESAKSNKRSVTHLPIRTWMEAQEAARNAHRVDSLRKIYEGFGPRATAEEKSRAFAQGREFFRADSDQSEYDKFNKVSDFFDVHFMIPAMMLTDALRKSDLF